MDQGKVLVLDDSEIVLEATRLALEGAGFSVSAISNVFQLNQAITKDPPDVILLDVRMPALPGDQVVKILKRYKFSRDIAVLLHSDLQPQELSEMVDKTGASGFIAKTSTPGDLVGQIKPWIESARTLGTPSA